MTDSIFERMDRLMPELLAEMRHDLAENPLAREFIVKRRAWVYNAGPGTRVILVYHYDDHPDLENQLRVLANSGLITDITYNNTKRYVMTEEFAQYLGAP